MPQSQIDPDIAAFVDALSRAWAEHPPFMTLPLDEAGAIAEAVRMPWREDGPAMARTVEHMAPTSRGAIRLRFYDPGLASPAPGLVHRHGGGFTLFSLDTHDRLMREYAAAGPARLEGAPGAPLAPRSPQNE